MEMDSEIMSYIPLIVADKSGASLFCFNPLPHNDDF